MSLDSDFFKTDERVSLKTRPSVKLTVVDSENSNGVINYLTVRYDSNHKKVEKWYNENELTRLRNL